MNEDNPDAELIFHASLPDRPESMVTDNILLLMAQDVDPSLPDIDGTSALEWAVRNNYEFPAQIMGGRRFWTIMKDFPLPLRKNPKNDALYARPFAMRYGFSNPARAFPVFAVPQAAPFAGRSGAAAR